MYVCARTDNTINYFLFKQTCIYNELATIYDHYTNSYCELKTLDCFIFIIKSLIY